MDRGHFRERTVDVATMSGSAALETTDGYNVRVRTIQQRNHLRLTFVNNRLFGKLLPIFDPLPQFLNCNGFDDVNHEVKCLGSMLAMREVVAVAGE